MPASALIGGNDVNINDIRGALGKPAARRSHAQALLKMEAEPCRKCGRPKETAFRTSLDCADCLRKEFEGDGLPLDEFDRKLSVIRFDQEMDRTRLRELGMAAPRFVTGGLAYG